MRFLLDENLSGHTRSWLRAHGHEVVRAPFRARDADLLALAQRQGAILLTRDQDFLTVLPSRSAGIIVIRIHPSVAEVITQAVRSLLEAETPERLLGSLVILRAHGYEIVR